MKWTRIAVLLALTSPAWAASANLTTNGSACPAATNTTAIVVGLAEDKGGATLTVSGTWTGTISFYGTGSGGSLWTALSATPLGSSTAVTSTTANGTWQVNASGFTGICMLSSASMTGTATVTITPSAASARSNGGSIGGGVSISATSPIVVSPSPITGTGTVSCPTCQTGTAFACSSISGGVPASGTCTVAVSSSQILNMFTTPVVFIAAQGSGTFIDVTKITVNYICNPCTKYTVSLGGAMELFYGTIDSSAGFSPQALINDPVSQFSSLNNPWADAGIGGGMPQTSVGPVSTTVNQPFQMENIGSGNYTLGTGTLKVFITYTIDSFQ